MRTIVTAPVRHLGLLREAVLHRIELGLDWRWHGIGVLQAYLDEGADPEVRVHLWSRRLMLPGIQASGNAHNHRFRLESTVLAGRLLHTEIALTPGPGAYETWDFVHARLHTDENRTEMRRTGEQFRVERGEVYLHPGSHYSFPRGAFHTSEPIDDLVVTLVEKHEQVAARAQVLAPVGLPPVPAFSGALTADLSSAVVAEAIAALSRPPRPSTTPHHQETP